MESKCTVNFFNVIYWGVGQAQRTGNGCYGEKLCEFLLNEGQTKDLPFRLISVSWDVNHR